MPKELFLNSLISEIDAMDETARTQVITDIHAKTWPTGFVTSEPSEYNTNNAYTRNINWYISQYLQRLA